jgi:hypothetical protein
MEVQARDARESSAEATRIALATAKAAQKSAEAANAQIQMMKDKERPRIQVTALAFARISPYSLSKIPLEFLNVGAMVALNVSAKAGGRISSKGLPKRESM